MRGVKALRRGNDRAKRIKALRILPQSFLRFTADRRIRKNRGKSRTDTAERTAPIRMKCRSCIKRRRAAASAAHSHRAKALIRGADGRRGGGERAQAWQSPALRGDSGVTVSVCAADYPRRGPRSASLSKYDPACEKFRKRY